MMHDMQSRGRAYSGIGLLAFLFNFVWEAWHAAYLYAGFTDGPRWYVSSHADFVEMITYASVVDAVILLGIFSAGTLIWRDSAWWQQMTTRKYFYFIGVTVGWAALIEYKAVMLWHQWAYNDLMPTIEGLGLSPLVQLAVTGLLARAVVMWLVNERRVNAVPWS